MKKRRPQRGAPRIKWWRLKDDNLRSEFKERVLGRIEPLEEVQDWWKVNCLEIRKAGEEILGLTSGKSPLPDKETWLWNDEVKEVVKRKKEAKKKWETSGGEADRVSFKTASKEAKRAVAQAKAKAGDDLYGELESSEGQKKIYNIAKARDKATKDFTHFRQIKDEHGSVLTEDSKVKSIWESYFNHLLNEENPRVVVGDGVPNEGITPGISRDEVKKV